MKDKETHNNVFDILDKIEFFQGQRAGRELWNNKPKEIQDKDISDFIKDINYIRSYLQDSVVLSKEEYKRITKELVTEQRATEIAKEYFEKIRKETAEKILREVDNESNGQTISITNYLRKKYGVEINE